MNCVITSDLADLEGTTNSWAEQTVPEHGESAQAGQMSVGG